jgi:hypothetical protein
MGPATITAKESIADQGFAVVPQVLTKAEREELIEQLGPASGAGRRGILELAPIAELSRSDRLLSLVRPHVRLNFRYLRWTPKTRPPVKMDFRWSAGEEKADYESKTQTA